MAHNYAVEFFLEDDGSSPVARWITEELSAAERRAVTAALSELVAEMGKDICATDFGKNIGGGLIELRLRQSEEQFLKRIGKKPAEPHAKDETVAILLRVFFHPHGEKRILVLHGYSKQDNPSKRHQQAQIGVARKRLAHWQKRERQQEKARKRAPPKGR